MVREASDGGVKVTSTGVRQDGAATKSSYTAKYDGKTMTTNGKGTDDEGKSTSLTIVSDKR